MMNLRMRGLDPGPLVHAIFCFALAKSVGCVSGVGSGIFFLTGVELIGDVLTLVVSYEEEWSPKVVDS